MRSQGTPLRRVYAEAQLGRVVPRGIGVIHCLRVRDDWNDVTLNRNHPKGLK